MLKRVLVVEENHNKMDDFMSSLAKSGYDILGVTSTVDAQHFLGTFRPDAVVVGYERAEGNGYEFASHLRKDGFDRALVLVSDDYLDRRGHPDIETLVDTHLFYPVRGDTLGLCVDLVIAKYESPSVPPTEPSLVQS